GSTLACSSPRLIAACHVLHRRLVPRHPPCALRYLTSNPPRPRGRVLLPVSPKSRHSTIRLGHLDRTKRVQGPPKALTTLSTSVVKQRTCIFRARGAGHMRTEASSA